MKRFSFTHYIPDNIPDDMAAQFFATWLNKHSEIAIIHDPRLFSIKTTGDEKGDDIVIEPVILTLPAVEITLSGCNPELTAKLRHIVEQAKAKQKE